MSGRKDPSTGSTMIDGLFELNWLLIFQRVFGFIWSMISELYFGVTRGTMPFLICVIAGVVAAFAVEHHWDYLLLRRFSVEFLYPAVLWNNTKYHVAAYFSGFVGWAFFRTVAKIGMENRAKDVFENAGLKSRKGQVPKLLAHELEKDGTHRMRIARSGLAKQDFEKAKGSMESSMGVYFNAIEEDRIRGTVDITYSKTPIPNTVELEFSDLNCLREGEFYVGAGHTGLKKISLADCPHLLVAGETGSGKSTFLHQFITGLYLKDPRIEMTLIDLKGGLEFTAFSDLPGVTVVTDREEASRRLAAFPEIIGKRMHILRRTGLKSIEDLHGEKKKLMNRHVVIVDEAAEMFLSTEDNAAKAILSQIARQGRALGLHLVVATQRPDTRALDSQIKANLTGVLCFKMLNDASSITVLGNGRATDLLPIPGRALWKLGPTLIELQVPWLDTEWAKQLLEPDAKTRAKDKSGSAPVDGENRNPDRFTPIQ